MRGVEETALAFGAACERAGVRYALVGAIAVSAWGQPRATADVDALVHLPPGVVDRLVEELAKDGLTADARDFRAALTDRSHVTVFDEASAFHVDVKLATSASERDEVQHARPLDLDGRRIWVAPPEETVAFKLKFGSEKDLQDARSILMRKVVKLDENRLRALARRLGVERELDRLIDETR